MMPIIEEQGQGEMNVIRDIIRPEDLDDEVNIIYRPMCFFCV